jgi:hypothetical protein
MNNMIENGRDRWATRRGISVAGTFWPVRELPTMRAWSQRVVDLVSRLSKTAPPISSRVFTTNPRARLPVPISFFLFLTRTLLVSPPPSIHCHLHLHLDLVLGFLQLKQSKREQLHFRNSPNE